MSERMTRYFNADKLPIIREPDDETADEDIEMTIATIPLPCSEVQSAEDICEAPPLILDYEITDDDSSDEHVDEVGAFDNDSDDSNAYMPIETEFIAHGNLYYDRDTIDLQVCCIGLMFWILSLLCAIIVYGLYNNVQILYVQQLGGVGKDNTFMLIPRTEWDLTNVIIEDKWAFQAKRVIVTQTETSKTCAFLQECVELLNDNKIHEDFFEYNFIVAPDGHVYEALGWQEPSSQYYDTPTMVVAFLGNYEERAPSQAQITQFKMLLLVSEQLHYLHVSYTIHGRKMNTEPKMLYSYLSNLKNWKKEVYVAAKKHYATAKDTVYVYPQFDLYWEPLLELVEL